MNFDFTTDQVALRDTVRAYLDDHWTTTALRAATDGPGLPDAMWAELTQLGVPMLLVPEAQNGLGLTLTDASLLFETFGETLTPGLVPDTMLASSVIARFGTADQREELLPAIAGGEMTLALALLDSPLSFDPASITTTARQAGNGWRLHGDKPMVPYAHLASRVLVAARTEGGIGLFLCDPRAEGATLTPRVLVDPTFRMSELRLDDVAADGLLGGVADSKALAYASAAAAAASSAQLTGMAGRGLAMTLDYAKQRKQFGRAIGSFQAIKHKLADMMVSYETARSATYYAHWALAQDDPAAEAAVSLAKAYAGDMARTVLNESIHIHGGIGFTWEYDLHFFLKRAKLLEYQHGDAAWHRERYAAAIIDQAVEQTIDKAAA